MFSFDLRSEPWIPVRDRENTLREISLHEALTNAASYQRIESESPLEVAALYRFLLAVLHRALEGPTTPKDNARWFREGFNLAAIEAYLERYEECFDLFHDERPFYQISDDTDELNEQNIESIAKLNIGLPSMHFDESAYVNPPEVTPAQAARMLLAMNSFSLSGGRGYFPGLITTSVLVVPVGENLLESFCYNLIPYPADQQKTDEPIWETQEVLTLERIRRNRLRSPLGLTRRYTWISRAIRLLPETASDLTVVKRMYYASAFAKDKKQDSQSPDPMTPHQKQDKKGLLPVRFHEGRGFWREIHSIIPQNIQSADCPPATVVTSLNVLSELGVPRRQQRIKALILGQAGKLQHETWHYWRQVLVEIPAYLSENRTTYELIKTALRRTEDVGEWLRMAGFEFVVRQPPESKENEDKVKHLKELFLKPPHKKEPQEIKVVRRQVNALPTQMDYWSRLERYFYQFLEEIDKAYDEQLAEKSWIERLIKTATETWQSTIHSTGSNPRALKAATTAQGPLYSHLKKLRESYGLNSKGGNGEQNQQG